MMGAAGLSLTHTAGAVLQGDFMSASLGWCGVLIAIAQPLLHRLGLADFSPAVDQLLQIVCPAIGLGGAKVLRDSEPTK